MGHSVGLRRFYFLVRVIDCSYEPLNQEKPLDDFARGSARRHQANAPPRSAPEVKLPEKLAAAALARQNARLARVSVTPGPYLSMRELH